MKKNKLYHTVEISGNIGEYKRIAKSCSDNNNQYFIYELPMKSGCSYKNLFHGQYKLLSHHLTIHSLEDSKKYYLSQYHYTAYLSTDNVAPHLQLHVYFDDRDSILKMTLSEQAADENSKHIEINELIKFRFSELARSSVMRVINELRAFQKMKSKELDASIRLIDKDLEALSKNYQENIIAYQSLLDTKIQRLSELVSISDNLVRAGSLQLSIAMKKKINREVSDVGASNSLFDNPYTSLATQPESEDSVKISKQDNRKRITQNENQSLNTKKIASNNNHLMKKTNYKKTLNNKSTSEIAKSIQTAEEKIEKYQAMLNVLSPKIEENSVHGDKKIPKTHTAKFANLIALLKESSNAIADARIQADDKTEFSDLEKIEKLLSQNHLEGKNLLIKLVRSGDFKGSDELEGYLGDCFEEIITESILNENADALDYVLRKCPNIHIDSIMVCDTLNPIEYCYQKNMSFSKCIEILVKHGASLMRKINDIPIAMWMIIDFDIPEYLPMILNNPRYKMHLAEFINDLCHHIDMFIESHESADYRIKTISEFNDIFKSFYRDLCEISHVHKGSHNKSLLKDYSQHVIGKLIQAKSMIISSRTTRSNTLNDVNAVIKSSNLSNSSTSVLSTHPSIKSVSFFSMPPNTTASEDTNKATCSSISVTPTCILNSK